MKNNLKYKKKIKDNWDQKCSYLFYIDKLYYNEWNKKGRTENQYGKLLKMYTYWTGLNVTVWKGKK